jgi:dihydrofolate reductase
MGKVLWHVTMSLDGFIAGPRDDMTWLAAYLGPNPTADEVLAQVGALLIGDRTYQQATTGEGKPYGGAWTGPQFVLSHHPPRNPPAGFTFLKGDVEEAVATAKSSAGDDKYVVVLGSDTARSCLSAGLVDEVLVHIAPVLLGDGIRFYEQPGGTNIKLERISLTEAPQVTNLWFRVASREMPHRLAGGG